MPRKRGKQSLGSGLAENARKKLKGRAKQLAEQEARAMGVKLKPKNKSKTKKTPRKK